MGGLLHLIQRGYGPLNDSPLLCGFNVAIKGLTRFDYFVQPQTTACVTERFMPTQAIRGRGAVMPVPLSWCLSRFPVSSSAFYSLRTNAERVLIKFAGDNHYHRQLNWLHFWAKLYKGQRILGMGQKIRIDVTNWCCHVVNDFANFTVRTVHCVRSVGESTARRRHHMTARGL